MKSVLQNWVIELPLMQQSALLSSVRGCDGFSKYDSSKKIVQAIRGTFLVDANHEIPGHSFMSENSVTDEDVDDFVVDMDRFPVHFLIHLLGSIQIIGYKHPRESIRCFWFFTYLKLVTALHLKPESLDELDERLCN